MAGPYRSEAPISAAGMAQRDPRLAHCQQRRRLPASIIAEITRAGGLVGTEAWWIGQNGPTGFSLSDAAVDWIEEVANGETPAASDDG